MNIMSLPSEALYLIVGVVIGFLFLIDARLYHKRCKLNKVLPNGDLLVIKYACSVMSVFAFPFTLTIFVGSLLYKLASKLADLILSK